MLGAYGAPPPYLDALRQRDVECERIDVELQLRLDAGIQCIMEGRDRFAIA